MEKVAEHTDKMVEEYDRYVRMGFSFIMPMELRNIVTKTHEVQMDAVKFVSKSVTDAMSKVFPSK